MGELVLDREMIDRPKEKYWISYIKSRVLNTKKNKNFLGFISGETGSGKSWSSLSIGEDCDPEFNVDRVVFSGFELMTLINSGKLKRGSAIVFEEVGVEMSNREWASVTNKMINYLIQTFRHQGFILIMNSPFMDFLDSATRKLFHAEMQTAGINLETQETRLKPLLIQYNSKKEKFYYKRLKVITKEGILPISVWNVPKPSSKLIEEYEVKKKAYTSKLNKNIMKELKIVEDKKQEKDKEQKQEELTEKQTMIYEMSKEGLKPIDISIKLKKHISVIHFHLRAIEKKGFKIPKANELDLTGVQNG